MQHEHPAQSFLSQVSSLANRNSQRLIHSPVFLPQVHFLMINFSLTVSRSHLGFVCYFDMHPRFPVVCISAANLLRSPSLTSALLEPWALRLRRDGPTPSFTAPLWSRSWSVGYLYRIVARPRYNIWSAELDLTLVIVNPSDRSDMRSSVSNVSIKGFSFKAVDLSQSESQYFIEPVETGAFHVYETVTMQRTRKNINLYYHLWKSPIAFTASFLCLALRCPPLTVTHIRYLHLHLLQLHSHLKYPACISTIWLPAFRLENKKNKNGAGQQA